MYKFENGIPIRMQVVFRGPMRKSSYPLFFKIRLTHSTPCYHYNSILNIENPSLLNSVTLTDEIINKYIVKLLLILLSFYPFSTCCISQIFSSFIDFKDHLPEYYLLLISNNYLNYFEISDAIINGKKYKSALKMCVQESHLPPHELFLNFHICLMEMHNVYGFQVKQEKDLLLHFCAVAVGFYLKCKNGEAKFSVDDRRKYFETEITEIDQVEKLIKDLMICLENEKEFSEMINAFDNLDDLDDYDSIKGMIHTSYWAYSNGHFS
jgi:hypothetical protein